MILITDKGIKFSIKLYWDMLMIFIILYSSLTVLYTVSFKPGEEFVAWYMGL